MANRQYPDGGANVSGDDLEQFVQNVGNVALLRIFVGTVLADGSPMIIYLQGLVATGDGGQGYFWWNQNNVSDDDGTNVIVPSGAGAGAWNRIIQANPTTLTIVHLTSNYTILPSDSGTHFDNFGAFGAVVASLPAPSEGLFFCFAVLAPQTLQINATGAVVIWIDTTPTVVAGHVSSNVAASSLCLEAHDSSQWLASSFTGTWNRDL